MVKNEKEVEIWKVHPEFNFIEVSNLGRVRTMDRVVPNGKGARVIKGKILTQAPNNKGYLRVHINVNGKQVIRRVHRLVAQTFIYNPDNLPQINHKDNNPANNNVSNLEWCTPEYNIEYKEKHGTSAAEALGVPVYAINLETLEVLRFESQMKAGMKLRINQSNIGAVLKGRYKQAGGFWFTEYNGDSPKISKDKLHEIKTEMRFRGGIYAVDLDKQKVCYFESQSEAGRSLGISNQSINDVLKGRQKISKGYWFVKDNGHVVETVKNKLHDVGGVGLKL